MVWVVEGRSGGMGEEEEEARSRVSAGKREFPHGDSNPGRVGESHVS